MFLLLLVEAVVAVVDCSAVVLVVEVDIVLAVAVAVDCVVDCVVAAAVVVDCVDAAAAGCCSFC